MKKITLRGINAWISLAMVVLILAHILIGVGVMVGFVRAGFSKIRMISDTLLLLTLIHALIGCILTVQSARSVKKTGAGYASENRLFWIRRISGFAIVIFLVLHLLQFVIPSSVGGIKAFGAAQLASAVFLVLSVTVHIISNIRPLFVSFGISGTKNKLLAVLLVIATICLIAAIGFVIYYVRWNIRMDFGA